MPAGNRASVDRIEEEEQLVFADRSADANAVLLSAIVRLDADGRKHAIDLLR